MSYERTGSAQDVEDLLRLTPESIDQRSNINSRIVSLYGEGKSIETICKELKLTQSTVSRILKEAGAFRSQGAVKRQIIAMHNAGTPTVDIWRVVGGSHDYVREVIRGVGNEDLQLGSRLAFRTVDAEKAKVKVLALAAEGYDKFQIAYKVGSFSSDRVAEWMKEL